MTSDEAKAAAAELRRFAKRIEEIMFKLDTRSFPCECCSTVRYENWQQNQLFSRLDGLTEKMENAAVLLAKGANNPEFLGEKEITTINDANTGHQR